MKKTKKSLYVFLLVGLLFLFSGCSRNFCSAEDRNNMKIAYRNKTAIYLSDMAIESDETLITSQLVLDTLLSEEFAKTLNDNNVSYDILRSNFKVHASDYLVKLDDPFYQAIYSDQNLIDLMTSTTGRMKIVADSVNELYTNQIRSISCLTITDNEVEHNSGATLTKKSWAYAFKLGPLEGVFIYPIAALMISLTNLIGSSGIGQLFAIVFTTFIIRLLVLALTFKSTLKAQKMNAIQPEIQALNKKYAGRTDPASRQRLSQETMQIYAKHGVNPLTSLIAPFATMPVFVAVYHAVSQTAIIKSGTVFGMNFGTAISEVIIGDKNIFAIILFLTMILVQFITMKLPQYLNKLKTKNVRKHYDDKTPTPNSMKYIMYIFLAMIVAMGWMLPSAMTIYWIASSLVSITQTLVIHKITTKKGAK